MHFVKQVPTNEWSFIKIWKENLLLSVRMVSLIFDDELSIPFTSV